MNVVIFDPDDSVRISVIAKTRPNGCVLAGLMMHGTRFFLPLPIINNW